MKHVGLLVLGSFINSLGTGLSAFSWASRSRMRLV